MKQLLSICTLVALLLSCGPSATSQQPDYNNAKEIVWLSLEEAQELNKKNPRKLIVDVYTHWCGPCKMMDRMTFKDPSIVEKINKEYYAVKFNGESGDAVNFKGTTYENKNYRADIPKNRRNSAHDLVRQFGIRGYPTLIVFDSDLNIMKNIVGFKQPQQLLGELPKS